MEGVDMDMVHRRVSAKGAPKLDTSAPRSVFDMAGTTARKTRQKMPAFDPDTIKVEKGVAIPAVSLRGGTEGPCTVLCRRLKAGESAALPKSYAGPLRAAATKLNKAKVGTFKVVVVDAGNVRVWRTA